LVKLEFIIGSHMDGHGPHMGAHGSHIGEHGPHAGMTYPPIFKCSEANGVVIFPENVGFARYRRFGVFGLHGHFHLILVFFKD
jgi:hypothetical protein